MLIIVAVAVAGVLGGAQALLLGGVLGLLAQQRLAVLARDLVIIGVDFGEGQEAVAVAAIIDERRLQRRFDPGYLGEIDIPLELLVLGGLEIKFLDPVSLDHGHPGFFPVARVDQHAHCHQNHSTRAARPRRNREASGARARKWTKARPIRRAPPMSGLQIN